MRRISRLWLASLCALVLPLTSCKSAYEARVQASNAPSLVSAYVVVANKDQLAGWEDPDKVFDLLQPAVQSLYEMFLQFEPTRNGDDYMLSWITHDVRSDYVEVWRNRDGTVGMKIRRGILDGLDDPAVLFVGDFGADGFDADLVTGKELENQAGATILLQRGKLKIEKKG